MTCWFNLKCFSPARLLEIQSRYADTSDRLFIISTYLKFCQRYFNLSVDVNCVCRGIPFTSFTFRHVNSLLLQLVLHFLVLIQYTLNMILKGLIAWNNFLVIFLHNSYCYFIVIFLYSNNFFLITRLKLLIIYRNDFFFNTYENIKAKTFIQSNILIF